jgi:signal transduction histidine kinase
METARHPLLVRQLRRHFGDQLVADTRWPAFLEAVDRAYHDADADRRLVDRAMDISSAELTVANSELRSLVRALPDVVFCVDAAGVVAHRGGRGTGMWAPDAIHGRRFVDVCGERQASVALAEVIHRRHTERFDVTVESGDGLKVFEVTLAPLGTTEVIALVRDATDIRRADELRLARDAAEAANRAKSAFLATVSHELRTPLNAIIGYSEMLAEDADGPMAEDLGRVLGAGRHLLELVNALLDVARIEAGRVDLAWATTDVRRLTTEVVAAIRPVADRSGNRIALEVERSVGTILTDAMRVRQILLNLLGNACKFTTDGTIVLRVASVERAGAPGVELAVSDNGVGMRASDLGRLFQDFSQLDDSVTRRFGGTGLGLAISRRLARLMGGDITVESAFGRGSTFRVWFPDHPDGATGADVGVDHDDVEVRP